MTTRKANWNEWFKNIKSTFHENVLCARWENEYNFYIIVNLSKDFIDFIKDMFYQPSSDLFLKHRVKLNVFLILETNTFVCHRCKLDKMMELLRININENTYVTAFMRFDQDSSSFIPEKKNKNDKEQVICFSKKLDDQIISRKSSYDEKSSAVCDNIEIKADSSKRLIVCKCESSRKNKICPSFQPEDSQNRINKNNVCSTETPKDSSLELGKSICKSRKSYRKAKSCPPRKPEDSPNNASNTVVCLNETHSHQRVHFCQSEQLYQMLTLCPVSENVDLPRIPSDNNVGTSSQGSSNTEHVLDMSLQEAIARMAPRPCLNMDQNDVRSSTLDDEQHSYDMTNPYSENNPTPMECEEYAHTAISDQPVRHDNTSSIRSEVGVSQDASRSETSISERSFDQTSQFQFDGISSDNAAASASEDRFPQPALGQHSRSFCQGLLGSSTSAQHQQHHLQHRDTTFTEPATLQAVARKQNRNDDLLRVLGRVRCPDYADLTDRLYTFLRWPSDIAQTPHQVAEAGFYYTGFQDIVRCFVCDGGLKNWDPDDNPWVEHARWFPECAFVRHVKGEEFINLVRMMTEEEDDPTVHAGATWERAETSNINADSASNEITEPSVLEHEDAQIVIGMGFSNKDVAMAINDIFKKDKQDFTSQEIADIILEKQMHGELIDSNLATDCLPSVGNTSTTGQAISENKHLKELLQCIECKTRQRNILFLPCTHHVVCESCSCDLHICTYCYRKIKEKVRTYMS